LVGWTRIADEFLFRILVVVVLVVVLFRVVVVVGPRQGMYQDPCMDLVSSSTKIKPSAKAPTKSAAWLAMYVDDTLYLVVKHPTHITPHHY
jgi:hypothetical protein